MLHEDVRVESPQTGQPLEATGETRYHRKEECPLSHAHGRWLDYTTLVWGMVLVGLGCWNTEPTEDTERASNAEKSRRKRGLVAKSVQEAPTLASNRGISPRRLFCNLYEESLAIQRSQIGQNLGRNGVRMSPKVITRYTVLAQPILAVTSVISIWTSWPSTSPGDSMKTV